MAEPQLLSESQIRYQLSQLSGWELRDGRIRKQYHFRTFLRSIVFVNSVAYLAEASGHHPDITVNYNRVTLRLTTHSKGGLTDRDFALAGEIDGKLGTKLIIAAQEADA